MGSGESGNLGNQWNRGGNNRELGNMGGNNGEFGNQGNRDLGNQGNRGKGELGNLVSVEEDGLCEAEKRALLLFFTGSSRVPLDGYSPPLTITQGVDMCMNALPRAHTCFNQLVLPRYASYEVCVKKLRFAIENTEGFELA
ncbi:hypothetical protein B484DRAFT_445494 [Ochromonadaceae sp. CCMP2298]|nr:hypothetical protein B484DRAFT_445494 [Ochromonadaceae sp. CCMP2298]